MKMTDGMTNVAMPTAASVEAALPVTRVSPDWRLVLDGGNGLTMTARASDDPARPFIIEHVEGGERRIADEPLDRASALRLLNAFRERNSTWRQEVRWSRLERYAPSTRQRGRGTRKRGRDGPRHQSANNMGANIAGIVVLGVALLIVLSSIFRIRIPFPSIMLPAPFNSVGAQAILGFVSLFYLLFLLALLIKLHEVRRARSWHSTAGRIVSSGIGVHHRKGVDGDTQVSNVPRVEYEYHVRGRTWRGSRLDFAERPTVLKRDDVARRFPIGGEVTVYYDPSDPSSSVLDRDATHLTWGCLLATVVLAAVLIGAMWFATEGPAIVAQRLPSSKPYVLIPAVLCAAVLARLTWMDKQKRSAARAWPSTSGIIVRSTVETVRSGHSDSPSTAWMPYIEYRYTVDGTEYHSRQVTLGASQGGSEAYARKQLAPYPVDRSVTVHYDPANPAEAALDVVGRYTWIMPMLTGLALAVAIWATGLL